MKGDEKRKWNFQLEIIFETPQRDGFSLLAGFIVSDVQGWQLHAGVVEGNNTVERVPCRVHFLFPCLLPPLSSSLLGSSMLMSVRQLSHLVKCTCKEAHFTRWMSDLGFWPCETAAQRCPSPFQGQGHLQSSIPKHNLSSLRGKDSEEGNVRCQYLSGKPSEEISS